MSRKFPRQPQARCLHCGQLFPIETFRAAAPICAQCERNGHNVRSPEEKCKACAMQQVVGPIDTPPTRIFL